MFSLLGDRDCLPSLNHACNHADDREDETLSLSRSVLVLQERG